MTTHTHKQIRDALATALTGLTTSGARVYKNRLYPMDTAELPGLRIYLDSDAVEVETIHSPLVYGHDLSVTVEACARASSALDDTLDTMALEIETALASGITISGKKIEPILTGSQYDDEPGSPPVGVKRLTFSMAYYTASNAPQTFI
jgi:hypothetical protein